jgi:hypothetical protein
MKDKGIPASDILDVVQAMLDASAGEIAPARSSAAERQARYRERKAESVTRDVTPPSLKDLEPYSPRVEVNPNPPPSKNPPKGGQKGSRLPSDWQPSDADRDAATAEGVPDREIDREASKFRDFWSAKAGKDGVKRDWPAVWRNWVRRACELRGWAPLAPSNEPRAGPTSVHINPVDDPDPWQAWAKHKGKQLPIDRNGGWHVPTKYPPE